MGFGLKRTDLCKYCSLRGDDTLAHGLYHMAKDELGHKMSERDASVIKSNREVKCKLTQK